MENPDLICSVQELIKSPMEIVPEDFITRDQETPVLHTHILTPIIDMQKLASKETMDSELEKLHDACKDWGIFQVMNHGIDPSVLDGLNHEVEQFFGLPLEERMKYKMRPGSFEGYGNMTRLGGKLDWGDRLFMITNPVCRRKSHLFSLLPSPMRETLDDYISQAQKLAMSLLLLMAKCLNVESSEIEKLFEDGLQTLRLSYYPPCPQPELVVGLTPHSDGSCITIMNQLSGVDGLQIQRQGVWLPVHILPGTLVVILGDTMEILSNAIYKSTEHRAIVNSAMERISVALFFNPNLDAEIGPIPSLIGPGDTALFKRMKTEDFVKGFFSRKLSSKSYLETLKAEEEEETKDKD